MGADDFMSYGVVDAPQDTKPVFQAAAVAAQPVHSTVEPETLAQMTTEGALLPKIKEAYQQLQTRFIDNQKLIQDSRDSIASLRNRMRELATAESFGADEEQNISHGKDEVRHDSCDTLINHVEQIRDSISTNTGQAESLLAPFKSGVELLELRVKHVRAIELLVPHMKEGITLQNKLTEVEALIKGLAQKLDIRAL